MLIRKVAFAATVLAVASSLASCSDEEPGVPGGQTPLPTPPTGASSGAPVEGLPHSGAPKVETPIADTSQWENDPCSAISADQLTSLGLTVPSPERHDIPNIGPGCMWEFDSESASLFSAGFATQGSGKGMSSLYAHKAAGTAAYFEELQPIEGHPAALEGPKDDRAIGVCDLGVGLRDDLLYTVVVTADPSTPQGKDPCDFAAKVAALAVQTMKGSS